MKTWATVLIACSIAAGAAPLRAGQLVDVAIIDRATGERIAVHPHQGKLYIAGTPGNRYTVSVINRTSGRVLAVVAVDGINAVTGETAAAEQAGYVLAPYQSFDILGWRKSLDEVAAFYFTRLADSYAARTDRPDHAGVIGIAVFRERPPQRPPIAPQSAPWSRSDGTPSSTGDTAAAEARRERDAIAAEERIGTGHGERQHSAVSYTDFHRATSYPSETITIYYDTRQNLLARGIIPSVAPVVTPNPFPAGRFVPDPRS